MLPKFLTTFYPLEKHLFLIPKFSLRIIGFDPESEQTLPTQIWAFCNFFILAYGCYAEFCHGILHLKIDMAIALDALCPVASSIMSLVKVCCIWWYRDEFKFLFERVKILTAEHNSNEKISVKRFYFTLATRLSALVLSSGFCTTISYSIRLIILNILRHLKGQEILYETPFKMIFPKVLLRLPFYPFTFLLSQWHGVITVVAFTAGDGIFLAFCFYFTILIKALGYDLVQAMEIKKETKARLKLVEFIKRHNEVIDLMNRFSNIMVVITLGHFVTSSIIIGMSVVDLLLFSGYSRLTYVAYTCAAFSQIFLYCLGGTVIMESSNELATIAYLSDWNNHNIDIQKTILFIIMRSQLPLRVKVPFFAPSLPTLTSILQFTGSLITLAKSFM